MRLEVCDEFDPSALWILHRNFNRLAIGGKTPSLWYDPAELVLPLLAPLGRLDDQHGRDAAVGWELHGNITKR